MRAGALAAARKTYPRVSSTERICPQCLYTYRNYSSRPAVAEQEQDERKVSRKQHEKQLDRDFFLSVFSTSATKRDARAYLSRFKDDTVPTKRVEKMSQELPAPEKDRKHRLKKSGVNLGGLYGQARAIKQSPVFTQGPLPDRIAPLVTGPIHVAIVKIRGIEKLNQQTLKGVAMTLSQLARLGLLSCVVVDGSPDKDGQDWRNAARKQCFRLANAISDLSKIGARVVDQVLEINPYEADLTSTVHVKGSVDVRMKDYLLAVLQRGLLPVIPPIAHTASSQMQRVSSDDVVLALTRELSGLNYSGGSDPSQTRKTTLEKIIVLDPLGGLPSSNKPDQSHVFVNLEEEYRDIRAEIQGTHASQQAEQHVENLDLIRNCLALLPPSCSALLTTPSDAAGSALSSLSTAAKRSSSPGVGTRAKRNPLIHNLLTDKPAVSSSLPTGRMGSLDAESPSRLDNAGSTLATFFKRGMPLTIIPDPRDSPWTSPGVAGSTLRLEANPEIDFPRLLYLIEDSFGKKLDVQHYLDRIKGRIAGIIVAGEYEGGAILTWETPPANPNTSAAQPRPPVPYLDKFAVLRKSQGSGGVADILFNAMVRTCLPEGVVWRSRKNNPVNKWYFERSTGTCKLPDSQWCMFWTGNEVDFARTEGPDSLVQDERWKDFVGVCSSIQASWADGRQKSPA